MRLKYLFVMLMTAALLFAACGKAEEVSPGITTSEAGESEAGTQEENEEIAMVRSSYFEFDFPCPADCNPDRIVGIDASYEMHGRIGGSELFIYPGLGHAAYEEAPDFNDRVFLFLENGS